MSVYSLWVNVVGISKVRKECKKYKIMEGFTDHLLFWNRKCKKIFVRSGIRTHALIRGPECSPHRSEEYISWVWRLRPLGHPDFVITQEFLKIIKTYFDYSNIRLKILFDIEVLWGQPIKLIQVVSTSEFHEYWWKDLGFIFLLSPPLVIGLRSKNIKFKLGKS